ncbi:hypothetical protein HYU13_03740 [Candidatus Woesearchaeota archaeon]|nr:hypothetical protein [Candidatus Woesearchaeota archaeon]
MRRQSGIKRSVHSPVYIPSSKKSDHRQQKILGFSYLRSLRSAKVNRPAVCPLPPVARVGFFVLIFHETDYLAVNHPWNTWVENEILTV